jgi:anaerobic selenocysteine-containing dehydrogenase
VGESRSEWAILRELAARTYPERSHLLGCETAEAIRQEIAVVIPFYRGIEKLKSAGDQFQYGGQRLFSAFSFGTEDGKAHFGTVDLPSITTESDTFWLSTRRGKQFNSIIYAKTDPLTGAERDSVFMNVDDATRLGLKPGECVRLKSDVGSFEGRVFLADIAKKNLQVHWPEGNSVIRRGVLDPASDIPDYNAIVRVEKRPQ